MNTFMERSGGGALQLAPVQHTMTNKLLMLLTALAAVLLCSGTTIDQGHRHGPDVQFVFEVATVTSGLAAICCLHRALLWRALSILALRAFFVIYALMTHFCFLVGHLPHSTWRSAVSVAAVHSQRSSSPSTSAAAALLLQQPMTVQQHLAYIQHRRRAQATRYSSFRMGPFLIALLLTVQPAMAAAGPSSTGSNQAAGAAITAAGLALAAAKLHSDPLQAAAAHRQSQLRRTNDNRFTTNPYVTSRSPLFSFPCTDDDMPYIPTYHKDEELGVAFGEAALENSEFGHRLRTVVAERQGAFCHDLSQLVGVDVSAPIFQGENVAFDIEPVAGKENAVIFQKDRRNMSKVENDAVNEYYGNLAELGFIQKAGEHVQHALTTVVAPKKDPETGEHLLESGALVLSDRGEV